MTGWGGLYYDGKGVMLKLDFELNEIPTDIEKNSQNDLNQGPVLLTPAFSDIIALNSNEPEAPELIEKYTPNSAIFDSQPDLLDAGGGCAAHLGIGWQRRFCADNPESDDGIGLSAKGNDLDDRGFAFRLGFHRSCHCEWSHCSLCECQ